MVKTGLLVNLRSLSYSFNAKLQVSSFCLRTQFFLKESILLCTRVPDSQFAIPNNEACTFFPVRFVSAAH